MAVLTYPQSNLEQKIRKISSYSTENGHFYDSHENGSILHMSLVVRKPAFCICENKGADQLLR